MQCENTRNEKYASFSGVIVPLATPLTADREYDASGMQRLVDFCVRQGVHGIFVMGSTGEALLFSPAERKKIAREVLQYVDGRLPVYVGVTALSPPEVIEFANDAAQDGADAAVLLPHVFFTHMGRTEVVDYFAHIAQRINLPLIAYSLGVATRIQEATILDLMELDNVAGIKESSGDMAMIKRLAHREPFLSGRKRMLAGVEIGLVEALRWPGVHGCIPSAANIAPGLFARTFDLCRAGDFAAAGQLQPIIDRLNPFYTTAGYSWSGIKGVKSALQALGICGAQMQFPFGQWSPADMQAIAQGLAELDLLQGAPKPSLSSVSQPTA